MALAAACLAAPMVSACAPASTPTPRPSPPNATSSPAFARTSTPRGTATRISTPTATHTPTLHPTPAAVMRLEDAEYHTLRWLAPALHPRVERSFYLTEDELRKVRPDLNPEVFASLWEEDEVAPGFPRAGSEHLLAVVIASTEEVGVRLDDPDPNNAAPGAGEDSAGRGGESVNGTVSAPARQRQRIAELWDVEAGQSLLAAEEVLFPWALEDLARQGGRRPLRPGLPTRTPTTTRSPMGALPTPQLTPALPPGVVAIPLGHGEVPAPLADVVRDWPAAVGSQWVFRSENVDTYARPSSWSTGTITWTVDAAWQIAPDVMVSRIQKVGSFTGTHAWAPQASPPDMDPASILMVTSPLLAGTFRYTFSNGIATDLKEQDLDGARRVLGASADSDPRNVNGPADLIGPFVRIPVQPWNNLSRTEEDHRTTIERLDPQDTWAGRFEDCYGIRVPDVNASGGNLSRICRGVGLVRSDVVSCHTMGCGTLTLDLIRYSLPAIVPITTPRTPPPRSPPASPDPPGG